MRNQDQRLYNDIQCIDIAYHPSRHPIQEMCVDVFIANDACLVGGLGKTTSHTTTTSHIDNSTTQHDDEKPASIALLTGANYSGKSVYLRQVCHMISAQRSYMTEYRTQVALIVYMAHVGRLVT